MIETLTPPRIPDEVYSLFISPLVERKRRMSLLVKWFQINYYLWQKEWQELPGQKTAFTLSNAEFAAALTAALVRYNIEIQTQRVWTWTHERNLPRPDNLRVMLGIADEGSWQREFARVALEIIKTKKDEKAEGV